MKRCTEFFPRAARKPRTFIKQGFNLVTFMVVALSFALPYNAPASSITPKAVSLPAMSRLSLTGVRRVLVISPHPDDETIASGGLIQIALENGSQVRVVIVTNGDGQLFAPAIFGIEDALTPAGYISMGERRQAESLAALEKLGVSSKDIIFLGYPDRGIEPMLDKNWEGARPFIAPFTHEMNSPYPNTFHSRASYCGESLLSDLATLIKDFRPDLVILPHPADEHSDHSATSVFTTRAVVSLQVADPTYQPKLWAYLVHYGNYPMSPKGDRSQGFIPPSSLVTEDNSWGYLTLAGRQEFKKYTAIQNYPTQTLLLGKFLPEFSRPNEIFMPISTVNEPVY